MKQAKARPSRSSAAVLTFLGFLTAGFSPIQAIDAPTAHGTEPEDPAALQQPPALYEQIDSMLGAAFLSLDVHQADDATFARRVYIDLTGRVPTANQLREYVADESPNKRETLVDQLLASPQFALHMTTVFDVMFMERRPDKHVKAPEWQGFLFQAMRENRPLNDLAADILGADGVDAALRPAAKFYLDREGEPNLLTRDVGRVFFGVDLQCAQCHDHPIIDSYYQSDYYGLNTFFNRGYLFEDKKKKMWFYAEKTEGVTAFKSVFSGEEGSTGPVVPGGVELIEPILKSTEAYEVAPADGVMPVAKYNRRAILSDYVRSGKSEAFDRNMANRLWAHLFGRGLVTPVDLHHDDNPPVHGPLLDLLATQLRESAKYDLRNFLKQLILTQAYARGFEPPTTLPHTVADLGTRQQNLQAQLEQLQQQRDAFEEELSKQRIAAIEVEEQFHATRKAALESIAKHSKADAAFKKADAERSKVAVVVDKNRAIEKELGGTLQSTKTALETLEDSELASLVPILEKRVAAAKSEADKQSPDLQKKTDAANKAKEAADAASKEADENRGKHDQDAKRLVASQQQVAPYLDKDAGFAQRRMLLEQQLEETETALSYLQHGNRLAELNSLIATAKQDTTQWATELAAAETSLADLQKNLTEATNQVAAVQGELNKVRARVVAAEQAQTLLAASISNWEKSSKAAGSADGAVEVTSLISGLKQRSAQISEQLAASKQQQKDAETDLQKMVARRDAVQAEVDTTTASVATKKSNLEKRRAELEKFTAEQSTTVAAREEAYTLIVDRWSAQGSLATLKPIAPEQMAWSMMVATGMMENYKRSALAELKKKAKEAAEKAKQPVPGDDWQPDPFEWERATTAKAAGAIKGFIPLFGAGSGQPQNEFFATVDQALFVSNGSTIHGWLNPSGNNLAARLNKLLDQPREFADELYISVLSRKPTDDETRAVENYIGSITEETERKSIPRDLAWALLASVEFRFNH